jgi:putative ABC transport system permease protein
MTSSLLQDFRYGARTLSERPGFALTVVLTLALGIGATTAIFSVLKTVLLDALPFSQSGQLVAIGQHNTAQDASPVTVGYATFLDWQRHLTAFKALGVSASWQPNLAGDEHAELLDGQSVTRDFFSVLGITPQLGRLFTPEEDQPERNDVVLLSSGLWQRRFNADAQIVGKRIALGSRDYTVVGVLPASFEPLLPATLGRPPDVWRPLGYDVSKPFACRTCLHLQAIGRLAAGATAESAQAQLDALSPALIKEFANEYPSTMGFELHPLREALVGGVDRSLWLLFAGVALVLLIACVDIASLMSLRATARAHELSIRATLGAERARLTRLMLSESALLGIAGGVLGVLVAFGVTQVVAQLGPESIPRLRNVQVDLGVLAFASLLTFVATLATSLWPAHRASQPRLSEALKDAGRVSTGPATGHMQTGLVIAQIAMACALTLGATLMARSFGRLLDVEPGFSSRDVVTVNLAIIGAGYRDDKSIPGFLDPLESQVRALPGVEQVGSVTPLPLDGGRDTAGFHIKDRPIADPDAPEFDRVFATPDYFSALQIPLRAGRLFTATDRPGQLPVALVNESLARREWPGESALGKQIQLGGRDEQAPWFTIVGVVGDVRQHSLDLDVAPQAYLAAAQNPQNYMALVVRTSLPVALIGEQVRRIAHSIDAGVPVYGATSMNDRVSDSLARRRFLLQLFGLFATTALLLSAIGIYGVVAYAVQRQTRAFGLRRALGASDRAVIGTVSVQGLRYLVAGLALGLPLALAWGRFLSSELYGVSGYDPLCVAFVVLTLAAVVCLATFVPVRRALRVDPMAALRHE